MFPRNKKSHTKKKSWKGDQKRKKEGNRPILHLRALKGKKTQFWAKGENQ